MTALGFSVSSCAPSDGMREKRQRKPQGYITYILLVTRRGAEIVDHDHDGVQSRYGRRGVGGVGVRYRVQLPAGPTSIRLARRCAEQVLGHGRVVPWGVVEAAGHGGGVAIGGAVAVVEAVSGIGVNESG